MRNLTTFLLTSLLLLAGCGSRVVVARAGTTMITMQELDGVKVLAPGADGNLAPAVVDLPIGTGVNTLTTEQMDAKLLGQYIKEPAK